MQNLTEDQQKSIDALTAAFLKVNTPQSGVKFNLVNADALLKDARLRDALKAAELADHEAWIKASREEAQRVCDLLKQDLEPLFSFKVIEESDQYDSVIPGRIKLPNVAIFSQQNSCIEHIKIRVCWKNYEDEQGVKRSRGAGFYYSGDRTLEEYVGRKHFLEKLKMYL